MKKSWVVALVAGIVTLACIDSNKLRAIQAEESRHFVEQANAEEERFEAQLQPYIERNRKLNETQHQDFLSETPMQFSN